MGLAKPLVDWALMSLWLSGSLYKWQGSVGYEFQAGTQTSQDQRAAGHCVARLHHQELAGSGQEQYAFTPFYLASDDSFPFVCFTKQWPGKVYECADAKDDRFAVKIQRHHHKAKRPGAEFGSALEKEGHLLQQMQGVCVRVDMLADTQQT